MRATRPRWRRWPSTRRPFPRSFRPRRRWASESPICGRRSPGCWRSIHRKVMRLSLSGQDDTRPHSPPWTSTMAETAQESAQRQAEILTQALPHMLHYDDTIVVVKYGGHAMGDESAARSFARDMVLLEQSGVNPVVVHGGGPQIGAMLAKLGIKSEFSGGLRITDRATVEIVEMVLAGSINKQIVGLINAEGGRAIGLSGKDGNMVTARKFMHTVESPYTGQPELVDLGFVGEPSKVD